MRAPRAGWGPPAVLLLLLLLLASGSAHGYKPVIIVHGILDGPEQFKNLSGFINEVHPGTEVQIISLFNDCESMKPLLIQVPEFRKAIEKIMNARPEGVHVLCFSQGGLVCRAVLSTTPNHNVHTFISLSSPLAGQYGGQMFKTAFLFCYNKVGQHFSFCDYWNDPHHRARYLKGNTFLPPINGEIPHQENFLRIKKMVLIGGPDDGVITPWQSRFYHFKKCPKLPAASCFLGNETGLS
uniref:palmitoyl-CoA hydrolase n=1 Tax=Poecilia reticulata TaxID=8081 RepID=A0A3P9N4I7_POERE